MRKLILFLAIIIPSMLHAQTSKNGRIQEGLAATRPIACSPGDVWTDTDDALSFQCFPANSWNTFAGSNILPNNNTFTGNNKFTKPLVIGPFTVATLPAPGATALNAIATVTDGTSGADCVTGGSTFQALCINTGAAWLSLGGGSGGTPCTTTALSIQFNNSGAFGCEPDLTFTAPHTLTMGASGILTLTAGAVVNGITAAMIPTLNQSTSGNAATASAFDHTPTNCGAGVSSTGVNSVGNAVGCFTPGGLSNPMSNVGDMIKGGSAGAATNLPGPTTPNGVAQTLIDVPSGGVATPEVWSLAGVPVDATNPATLLVTDRANYLNWTSGTALALPAVAGSFSFNFPFAIQNTSTTLTITPNAGASDLIDGAASGTLIPNFAAFIYQDGTTAPGHWFSVKFPTFASLGSTCASAITWSTTTGFGCNSGIGAGTVTNPNGNFTIGQTLVAQNATVGATTTFQSIDCAIGYGVVGDGSTNDSTHMQNCANALPTSGGTLVIPAGLNVVLNSTVTLKPGTKILCAGRTSFGSGETLEAVHFQTAAAIVLFKIGTWGGSLQQSGTTFENCAFRDTSASNNTALGAVAIFNTNRTEFIHVSFEDFNLPATAAPPAPTASAGSGATNYWTKVSCIGDAGNETLPSLETATASGTTTLTITGQTAGNCPAPMTGWVPYSNTTGTNKEVMQTESGNCTLNASGTGCALGQNWVGTVSNTGTVNGLSSPYAFDTSAGFGIITNSQGNGAATDASYNKMENSFCRNTQNCLADNGGSFVISGGGEYGNNQYAFVSNARQASRMTISDVAIESANNSTSVACGGLSGCILTGNKFEATNTGANGVICINLNVPRNTVLGNSFTKCNTAIIKEAANSAPFFSGDNIIDIRNQSVNGTTLISGGPLSSDLVFGGTENNGIGSVIPTLNVGTALTIPFIAGCVPTVTNTFCYNSTNGAQMAWVNGASAFEANFPAAPAGNAFVKTTGVIGQLVEDISLSLPGNIHSTGNTAAITTATLCAASAGACNQVGQYHIHWDFIETGTACATPATGGVTLLLTWTDTNATTHSAVSLGMDDASAINAVSQTFHFQTSLAAAWGSGDFNVSTNGSVIQYATGYTACGVGTGTYQLDIGVTRIQ